MVIFHCYVSSPEGNNRSIHLNSEPPKNTLRFLISLEPWLMAEVQLCIGFVGKIFTGFTMSGWWSWWCNNHLEKIWKSMGRMTSHILWKIKTGWNHQPDVFSHDIWGCSGFNMSFNQSIEPNWSRPKIGGRIGASILTHTPIPQPSNQVSLNDGQSCKEIG